MTIVDFFRNGRKCRCLFLKNKWNRCRAEPTQGNWFAIPFGKDPAHQLFLPVPPTSPPSHGTPFFYTVWLRVGVGVWLGSSHSFCPASSSFVPKHDDPLFPHHLRTVTKGPGHQNSRCRSYHAVKKYHHPTKHQI